MEFTKKDVQNLKMIRDLDDLDLNDDLSIIGENTPTSTSGG